MDLLHRRAVVDWLLAWVGTGVALFGGIAAFTGAPGETVLGVAAAVAAVFAVGGVLAGALFVALVRAIASTGRSHSRVIHASLGAVAGLSVAVLPVIGPRVSTGRDSAIAFACAGLLGALVVTRRRQARRAPTRAEIS